MEPKLKYATIRMSHWRHTMVDGAEFWISCKRPAFLSVFSHLQMIQNLAHLPSCGVNVTSELAQVWLFYYVWHVNKFYLIFPICDKKDLLFTVLSREIE